MPDLLSQRLKEVSLGQVRSRPSLPVAKVTNPLGGPGDGTQKAPADDQQGGERDEQCLGQDAQVGFPAQSSGFPIDKAGIMKGRQGPSHSRFTVEGQHIQVGGVLVERDEPAVACVLRNQARDCAHFAVKVTLKPRSDSKGVG